MKKVISLILCFILLLSVTAFADSAEPQVDVLQRFFIYSLSLDENLRPQLVDILKTIRHYKELTEEKIELLRPFYPEFNDADLRKALRIYSERSTGNMDNICDMILFGMREMPYKANMPTIRSAFNRYIIGDSGDDRGIDYFSTLISIYDFYTLFGGDSTIATNKEKLPGLITFFISENMPQEVIFKVSSAIKFMPQLAETLSVYSGSNLFLQLFAFAEDIINDCSTREIAYFKWAMDEIGVFTGGSAPTEGNKKFDGLTFRDLDSSEWAVSNIRELVNKGIINGHSKYIFAPEDNVTREQFVKMIVLAFKFELSNDKLPFKDTLPGEWYYPYIGAAFKYNIVNGESATSFGVESPITREQMAAILYRVCKAKNIALANENQITFSDYAEISTYAKDAVSAMSAAGIINGIGNGTFAPTQNATRAQAAAMISRLIK